MLKIAASSDNFLGGISSSFLLLVLFAVGHGGDITASATELIHSKHHVLLL